MLGDRAEQPTIAVSLAGRNWRSTYEEQAFSADYGLKYARADGSFWSFGLGGSGWVSIAPADSAKPGNTLAVS